MNLMMKQMELNKKLIFAQKNNITIPKICSLLTLDIAIKESIIPNAEPAHNFCKKHSLTGPAIITNVLFFPTVLD